MDITKDGQNCQEGAAASSEDDSTNEAEYVEEERVAC